VSLKFRKLESAQKANAKVQVRFEDGTTVEGQITDLDSTDVCLSTPSGERIVALKAIVDVNVEGQKSPVIGTQSAPPPLSPVSPAMSPQIPARVAQTASEVEAKFPSLAWPYMILPEINQNNPLPKYRLLGNEGTLWGTAINFVKNKNWVSAAEKFQKLTETAPETIFFYNAGIAYANAKDYTTAFIYFEQSSTVTPNLNSYLGGIIATLNAEFWHQATHWMLTYMALDPQTPKHSQVAIDFALGFGLYATALKSLVGELNKHASVDAKWVLERLAVIAMKTTLLHPSITGELEKLLALATPTAQLVLQIASTMQQGVTDIPSLIYRNSEAHEKAVIEKSPQFKVKQINELRIQAERARQQVKLAEAKTLYEKLLALAPNDIAAQTGLRDVETRLAPPSIPPARPTGQVLNPPTQGGGYGYSSLYQKAKKAGDSGSLPEAIRLYEECLRKGINVSSSVMDLASIYLRQENMAKGIALILKYESQLAQISAKNLLGALYYKNGEYDKAYQAYEAVSKLQPTYPAKVPSMVSMATTRIKQMRLDDAKQILLTAKGYRASFGLANSVQGLLDRIEAGYFTPTEGSPEENIDVDSDGNLLLKIRRAVGVGAATDGIGVFLEAELLSAKVVGLDRAKIENQEFTIDDVDYLRRYAGRFGAKKPKERADYFRSAAKVLVKLDKRDDDRFKTCLRGFSAAQADHFAIHNFDSARAYYAECFRIETVIDEQLRVKLTQMMMTFVCSKEEFIDLERPRYTEIEILTRSLKHTPDQTIRCIIMLSRLNVEILPQEALNDDGNLLQEFTKALCNMLNVPTPNTPSQAIARLIEEGQTRIGQVELEIKTQYDQFKSQATSCQRIHDTHEAFLRWSPDFMNAGVDFDGTDSSRHEELHRIIRLFVRFFQEPIYEEKANLHTSLISQIDRIHRDIEEYPTYFSRCYMLPVLTVWRSQIDSFFGEVTRNSQPNLEVTEVAKTIPADELKLHLIISNKNGKSSASNVRMRVLPTSDNSYAVTDSEFSLDRTLPSGEESTLVISIQLKTQEPAFSLNYQLIYITRQGDEEITPENSLAVRLETDAFSEIENPYEAWAASNQVTDRDMFKGRESLIQELSRLYDVSTQRKMIVIWGQKRAGKSSILYHFKDRINEQAIRSEHPKVIAFGLSMGDIQDYTLADLFYRISREMDKAFTGVLKQRGITLEKHPITRDEFKDDPFGVFRDYAEIRIDQVKQYIGDFNPLIIIDEFTYIYQEILNKRLSPNFMRGWKALAERRMFSFLLCGIDEMPDFIRAYPNEFAIAEPVRVSYLDDESARELIEQPIWDHHRDRSRFQERALVRIRELTGNSAFYIQIFNNRLVNYLNDEQTGYVTEADVNEAANQLVWGTYSLNLVTHFDNLTRFKDNSDDPDNIKLEGVVLRCIANLTRTQQYASREAILAEFDANYHEQIKSILSTLVTREVLRSRESHNQYMFIVGLFKEWLNKNLPYEGGK
jgi:tetratricopeptide (TPR) repeat protein